jgi:glucoselysine-6-phosphate deglycase
MSQRYAMIKEIKEQSRLLNMLLQGREELCKEFVSLYQKHPFKKILFVGNGSPYYAGCTLRFAAEKLLKAESQAVQSGIFNNHTDYNIAKKFRPEEILLVCPAESGHSKGQVDAARRAKSEGVYVMSTTLNPGGVLARTSDVVLAKPGKHEIAMASTKGQTMAIFMILLNFLEAAYCIGNLSRKEYEVYLSACEELPRNVEKTIDDTISWFKINEKRVMEAQKYFLLGYGANFGTVQEASLKFFECHSKPTISLELEESLHGPFRALGEEDISFFVAAEDCKERVRMQRLFQALKPICKNCIMIQSINNPAKGDVLSIHSSDVEFVDTIEYLVCLQVLSFLIADRMEIDLSVPLVASLDELMLPAYED